MQPNNSMYLLVVLQTCCIGGLSPLDFHFHMEYSLQEKVKITMEFYYGSKICSYYAMEYAT